MGGPWVSQSEGQVQQRQKEAAVGMWDLIHQAKGSPGWGHSANPASCQAVPCELSCSAKRCGVTLCGRKDCRDVGPCHLSCPMSGSGLPGVHQPDPSTGPARSCSSANLAEQFLSTQWSTTAGSMGLSLGPRPPDILPRSLSFPLQQKGAAPGMRLQPRGRVLSGQSVSCCIE